MFAFIISFIAFVFYYQKYFIYKNSKRIWLIENRSMCPFFISHVYFVEMYLGKYTTLKWFLKL